MVDQEVLPVPSFRLLLTQAGCMVPCQDQRCFSLEKEHAVLGKLSQIHSTGIRGIF